MNANDRPITICGIIPAAGQSRRMGRAKQSLPFDASTITGTVAATMLSAGIDSVVVVARTDLADTLDLPDDRRLTVIFNDEPASEMIDSIRLALKHMSHHRRDDGRETSCNNGVLVVPGDMPTVPLIAYRRSMAAFKNDPARIIIASHHGRRGHPMIFPAALAAALHNVQGGLNELPRRFPELVTEVNVSDPGVVHDIDRPADYQRLKHNR